MKFTCNDVLLVHNNDVLSYAVDSVGNRKYQVYLDMYGPSFLHAEERKDAITCNEIINDIVNAITETSTPKGRFLEFDEKNNVWYNVGTGAIPCQRTRSGLLGLLVKSSRKEYNSDKPIVEMSKTKRARTMKALHCSEKMLRAVVNLNDERFKVKDPVLMNDTSCAPTLEKKSFLKRSAEENIALSDPKINTKKRKITSTEEVHANLTCNLSVKDVTEKSIQTFCNPCTRNEYLPGVEIDRFIASFEETDISYMLDILKDTPEIIAQKKNELKNNCDIYKDTCSAIATSGRKTQQNKPNKVNDYLESQNTCLSYKPDECLNVCPINVNEDVNGLIIPGEFLELLLQ